ncbi:MAG: tetratricopeptide repeat protein [Chitinispirillaceae bacterium]|nr:tetratricopeptide repeat protein [Chitinispirillaceae bacterium]
MNRKYAVVVLLCMAVPFGGCSPMSMVKSREDPAVRDDLQKGMERLGKKLDEFQKTQGELLRLIRADQQVRLDEIEKKVGELGSGLSECQYRLSKIDEHIEEVQRRLQVKQRSDSLSVDMRDEKAGRLFEVAMRDFSAGRFEVARKGFLDLSSRYPESENGMEAAYWAGECLYAKNSPAAAVKELLGYLKKYPDGGKACVALYKLGMCYEKMKKEKSRDLVWDKLLKKCPDSREAKNVKSRE